MPCQWLVVSLLCMALEHEIVLASKILLMPANEGSHVRFFSVVGQALQQHNHTVHVLVGDNMKTHVEKRDLPSKSLGNKLSAITDRIKQIAFMQMSWEKVKAMYNSMNAIPTEYCGAALNAINYGDLEAEKYDLVMIDMMDVLRCMYVIPYRLDVPYISIGATHKPWEARVPAMPSSEGQLGAYIITKDANFFDRVRNTIISVVKHISLPLPSWVSNSYVEKYAPNRPPTTLAEIYSKSEMWISNMDQVCLDTPRVHSLHYQFIGGLGWTAAKDLPEGDLKTFADGATDGLIVLTFGSILDTFPDEILFKLFSVFKWLPQRIVMRFNGDLPNEVPKNVMLSSWLPQNDLLGHINTVLFITHGGNNGQMEALFHGVPMLTTPILADQFYNAKRAALRGYGLALDIYAADEEELHSSIVELISNPKYSEAVKQCSEILLDLPNPQQTLIYWVNHILKFGGDHLKPTSMDLPLWQFFLLDVFAFLLFTFSVMSAFGFFCCRCIGRRCTNKVKKD